jgi:Big-like domain-containing protein/VCBS repeat protein
MSSKVGRNHLLANASSFITILIALLGTTVLAQTAARAPVRRSSTEKSSPAAQDSGNPLFLPPIAYNSGGYPTTVAVADVNGNGKPDLVVANLGGTVGVLLGNGDGTFQAAVTYPTVGYSPGSVAVADLNGDGKPDLAVATGAPPVGWSSNMSLFMGNGDGTFQPAVGYDCGGDASITIADVNGDGNEDLLLAISNGGGLAGVLLGNGDGTFQPCTTYGTGGVYPFPITVGDLNGDGKPDLVVGNFFGQAGNTTTVGVLLGNGDGTFRPAVTYFSGGNQVTAVLVAGLRGNGKLDVVVVNCVPGGSSACGEKYAKHGVVGVLLGSGDGTLESVVPYDSGGLAAFGGAIADVDGDGKLDVVVTNGFTGDGSIGVLLGNGDGTFQGVITYTTAGPEPYPATFGNVLMADVNGDGRPDLVMAGSGVVAMMLNNTGPHTSTTTTLTSSTNPVNVLEPVTYTATVTGEPGKILTGTVVFQDGAITMATVTLSAGHAQYTTSYKGSAKGFHSLTASYSGDYYNSVSTSATLSENVLAPSRMKLTSSLSPALPDQPVTFTATVTSAYGSIPNGETIGFYDGGRTIGTGITAEGTCTFTTSLLSPGTHTIQAAYPGDSQFGPSSGKAIQVVAYTTSTSFISSLNPSLYGQKVTWTATVTSSGSFMPTGKVRFTWSGYTIGSATLNSSGVATLTRSNLNADSYPLTAVYAGDADNLGSTSTVLNQVVLETTSTATLTSSPNPSMQGQVVTFTAKISSPTVIPTGPVTFTAGKTVLGTAQLSVGKATLTVSSLAVGSTKVTATYYGNSNIAKSSASVVQTVQ